MLKQHLQFKLSQKLSPQQIQLMKLIQLPTQAFEQRLKTGSWKRILHWKAERPKMILWRMVTRIPMMILQIVRAFQPMKSTLMIT